jgi:lipoprotein-anchoring transpeptidase ErfK/SrfK
VLWVLLIILATAALMSAQTVNSNSFRVEIDLQEQTAYLLRGRQLLLESPISSGRYGHLTEAGSFKVVEKERDHYSSIYGKIVDAHGNTIVADADIDMKVPPGGKFIPAPMHYFMRFNGSDGMHAGYLPGYPASHGCVRMPERLAIAFFNSVEIGTPVTVFGRTPRTAESYRFGRQQRQTAWPWFGRPFDSPPARPFQPSYDTGYLPPWWR